MGTETTLSPFPAQKLFQLALEGGAFLHGQGCVQGALTVYIVFRISAYRFPKAGMSGFVLSHLHENMPLKIVPFIVPYLGAKELTQGAFRIILPEHFACQMLGILWREGMGVGVCTLGRSQAERFLIGKVQRQQLLLSGTLLFRVQELIRMTFFYQCTVGGTNLLRIGGAVKAQHFKGIVRRTTSFLWQGAL